MKEAIEKNPIIFSGLLFAILSLLLNALSILSIGMAHIYDIIHAFPTIFIYNPIIEAMNGYVPTEFIYVPLAVLLDGLIGLLVGWIGTKIVKKKTQQYVIFIVLFFCIYWFGITYQWLPIF
ncbi:MAG: hypothetical protein ACI35O_02685 [Bacillaceae bacterium]